MAKTWKAWTDEENASLANMAERGATVEEIARLLNRSVGAVYSKAYTLGVSLCGGRRRWSTEEDERLRLLAAKVLSAPVIAELMGRTAKAINVRAQILGIHTAKCGEYMEHELILLRELGPTHSPQEMAERLPGRTVCAVYNKARRMGIKLYDGR